MEIPDRYLGRVFTWSITVKASSTGETRAGSLEFGVVVEGPHWTGVSGATGGAGGAVVTPGTVCGGHNTSPIDSKGGCCFHWVAITKEKSTLKFLDCHNYVNLAF